jgi:hypothetical protein
LSTALEFAPEFPLSGTAVVHDASTEAVVVPTDVAVAANTDTHVPVILTVVAGTWASSSTPSARAPRDFSDSKQVHALDTGSNSMHRLVRDDSQNVPHTARRSASLSDVDT